MVFRYHFISYTTKFVNITQIENFIPGLLKCIKNVEKAASNQKDGWFNINVYM